MTLQTIIAGDAEQGEASGAFSLNVIFREIKEDDETYWVAECLEIPGCVSQGSSLEEAQKNIDDATRLCLSVIFEDCIKRIAANHEMPDLLNISSQKRLRVNPTPHLQYA
jgi:predicted RNase H-like HicB family nuclease